MDIQKALHLHDWLDLKKNKGLANLAGAYNITEKEDGWYGYIDFLPGVSRCIKSRAHREIPSMQHIVPELTTHTYGRLIFEILLTDVKDFHTLNGILNRQEPAVNAYIMPHDFIPYYNGALHPEREFVDRRQYVKDWILANGIQYVRAPNELGTTSNLAEIMAIADKVWNKGGEGLIIRNLFDSYYPGTRHNSMMKIKMEKTLDLLCVGTETGSVGHQFENVVTTLIVKDGMGRIHKVSGLNNADKNRFTMFPGEAIGRVVQVKVMKRCKDGSLREPRFQCVRYDKGECDID